MKKILLFAIFIFLVSILNAQEKDPIKGEKILNISRGVCLSLKSIEYEVHQKPARGRSSKHWPFIKAKIYQQRADVKDVNFDKALIYAHGTMKLNRRESEFKFSYNGDKIELQRNKRQAVKRVNAVNRESTAAIFGQHLTMLRIRPYMEEKTYRSPSRVFYLGKEFKNGGDTYKIQCEYDMYFQVGDSKSSSKRTFIDIWWINTMTFLPVAYSDNVVYKDISIVSVNKEKPISFFSVVSKKEKVKDYNSAELEKEMHKNVLLEENSVAPKWRSVSQDGKEFSSDNLKGKVVLLDFWGTWCGPCIVAMPNIEAIHNSFKNRKDVVVIGISAGEKKPNAAENYFTEKGYTYIHIPKGDEIAKKFKVKVYPTVYIIDKNGKIVDAAAGYNEERDTKRFKQVIQQHL